MSFLKELYQNFHIFLYLNHIKNVISSILIFFLSISEIILQYIKIDPLIYRRVISKPIADLEN